MPTWVVTGRLGDDDGWNYADYHRISQSSARRTGLTAHRDGEEQIQILAVALSLDICKKIFLHGIAVLLISDIKDYSPGL